MAKLQSSSITNVAVVNQAAGGNTILSGGLGPPLLQRYKRDALEQPGTKWVMIFEGVNDIGSAATSSSTQSSIATKIISAYKQIAADAKAKGFVTIGATITPFGGSGQAYSDPNREATRQTVNKWILDSSAGTFDYAVDFGKAIEDPAKKGQMKAAFDYSGDHLHPNATGYAAMVETIPLSIFKK